MNRKKVRIIFNRRELEELLRAFYIITKIRIVVFDDKFEKISAYPESHLPYCTILRKDERAKNACRQCDSEGCLRCKKQKQIYMYECHAGLKEIVLPLIDGDIIIGYLMLGQVILEDGKQRQEKWQELYNRVKKYDINFTELEECYWRNELLTEETLLAAAKIMETCASHLYLMRTIKLQEEDLAKRIEDYIAAHLREEITVEGICNEFNVRRTKLYKIADHNFGEGLAKTIRKSRMREAERLLKETDMKISAIAEAIGYQDYNYFTKVFKREIGITPREYRKKFKGVFISEKE